MTEPCFTARVLFSAPPKIEGAAPPGVRVSAHATRIPDEDVARLITSAWYWPEAKQALDAHVGHVELTLCAEVGTPVDRALALTAAIASLADRPDAVAVVWDATGLAHDPGQWTAQAEDASAEDLPMFLWIAFEGDENDDGSRTLRTRGVPAYGALEVEVASSRRDGEEVLEAVCDVALFVMTSSIPLEDGEQVEVTLGKVRVRIEPSLRNDGTRAYRLRLP